MPNPAAVGHDCVFVYEDRKVGLRWMPGAPRPSWRFPRPRRLGVITFKGLQPEFDPCQPTELIVDEFWNRGRMFDGRTIYAAAGLRLQTAYCQGYVREREQDLLDKLNRHETRRLCKRTWPNYIELDESYGDGRQELISPAEMKAQCLVYREARLLIAI